MSTSSSTDHGSSLSSAFETSRSSNSSGSSSTKTTSSSGRRVSWGAETDVRFIPKKKELEDAYEESLKTKDWKDVNNLYGPQRQIASEKPSKSAFRKRNTDPMLLSARSSGVYDYTRQPQSYKTFDDEEVPRDKRRDWSASWDPAVRGNHKYNVGSTTNRSERYQQMYNKVAGEDPYFVRQWGKNTKKTPGSWVRNKGQSPYTLPPSTAPAISTAPSATTPTSTSENEAEKKQSSVESFFPYRSAYDLEDGATSALGNGMRIKVVYDDITGEKTTHIWAPDSACELSLEQSGQKLDIHISNAWEKPVEKWATDRTSAYSTSVADLQQSHQQLFESLCQSYYVADDNFYDVAKLSCIALDHLYSVGQSQTDAELQSILTSFMKSKGFQPKTQTFPAASMATGFSASERAADPGLSWNHGSSMGSSVFV